MNELVKASDFKGPVISGTVTVALADLDKMRTEHAQAVQLAKELQERQMQVRVTLRNVEERYRTEFSRYSGTQLHKTEHLLGETIEYKNLDDFRDLIAKEERTKLLDVIEKREREITNLTSRVKAKAEVIGKNELEIKALKEQKAALEKEKGALEVSVPPLEKELIQVKGQLENSQTLVKDLRSLLMDKTVAGKISKFFGIW